MDGWSDAGHRGQGYHVDVFGDGGDTRDFLSQPSGFNSQPSGFNGTGYTYHTSSSTNPNRLGMAALDLNSSEGWPGLGSNEGLLRSGTEDSDFGSTQGPPLFCPPPRSGRGTLGLRGGRGGVGRGGPTLGRGGSMSLGGGRIPPYGAASGSSDGSRGRGTPLRGTIPPPTFDAEDENSYAQVPVRLLLLNPNNLLIVILGYRCIRCIRVASSTSLYFYTCYVCYDCYSVLVCIFILVVCML
jgi:hypothetical protein